MGYLVRVAKRELQDEFYQLNGGLFETDILEYRRRCEDYVIGNIRSQLRELEKRFRGRTVFARVKSAYDKGEYLERRIEEYALKYSGCKNRKSQRKISKQVFVMLKHFFPSDSSEDRASFRTFYEEYRNMRC